MSWNLYASFLQRPELIRWNSGGIIIHAPFWLFSFILRTKKLRAWSACRALVRPSPLKSSPRNLPSRSSIRVIHHRLTFGPYRWISEGKGPTQEFISKVLRNQTFRITGTWRNFIKLEMDFNQVPPVGLAFNLNINSKFLDWQFIPLAFNPSSPPGGTRKLIQ